jgi:hypothetical protein
MMQYIKDHWNGALPLIKAYWIGAAVAFVAASVIGGLAVITTALFEVFVLEAVSSSLVYSLIWLAVVLAPFVWWAVGVWRSAETWTIENAKTAQFHYGRAAQLVVILMSIWFVLKIALAFIL